MPMLETRLLFPSLLITALATPALSQETTATPDTSARQKHVESENVHDDPPTSLPETPPLPEGMTLDDVLEYSSRPPPEHYPDPIPDDAIHHFTLFDQLEYRIGDRAKDELGWDAQGWIGYDYDRLWWKSEGEAAFDGTDHGGSENDLLYSRLVTPFWYVQVGAQYANEWESTDYDDLWSGALALQGTAPGTFEIDASLYLSDRADLTATIEAEYDLRLTQRAVIQPRLELGFAAQDVPERSLGAGMTEGTVDLRLRYEILREVAPYIGFRYQFQPGETGNLAEASGGEDENVWLLLGLRLAI